MLMKKRGIFHHQIQYVACKKTKSSQYPILALKYSCIKVDVFHHTQLMNYTKKVCYEFIFGLNCLDPNIFLAYVKYKMGAKYLILIHVDNIVN